MVEYILEFEGENFSNEYKNLKPLDGMVHDEWEEAIVNYENARKESIKTLNCEKEVEAFNLLAIKCGTHIYSTAARIWRRHFM